MLKYISSINKYCLGMSIVTKYFDGCGVLGILRRNNSKDKIPGDIPIIAMEPAKPRGAGLGSGFAVFNTEGGALRLGVFSRYESTKYVADLLRDYLHDNGFSIVSSRVRAETKGIVDIEYIVEGDGNIDNIIHEFNRVLWKGGMLGRVYYWGRHVEVFKGVGYPEDIAEVYDISKVSGDLWIAHTRFPTNSPGYLPYWSHPFSVNDIAVVHNGELSSYGLHVSHLSSALGIDGLVGTDSEIVSYIMNYLVNSVGLSVEDAVKVLIGDDLGLTVLNADLRGLMRKLRWAVLDGPFTIVMGIWTNNDLYMVALADRFKLRPVVVGMDESNYYVASEEAQIRAVSPNARVWTLEPGGYFIVSLRRGIISWGRVLDQVEVFFPNRLFPRYSGSDAIDATGLSYREINEEILRRFLRGDRVVRVINVNGQRYIGVNLPRYGLRDVTVEIYGTPGNSLANLNNGVNFVVYGNAQDDVADTMHGGSVIIHGDARDVVGQALQGGYIFIRGNAGNRVGIQMREYVNKRPYLVVGGRVDDYLGEYMAGGVIMVLGIDAYLQGKDVELVGKYVGSGMVSGKIYIRGRVDQSKIGLSPLVGDVKALMKTAENVYSELIIKVMSKFSGGTKPRVEYRELYEDEIRELNPILNRYANYLNIDYSIIEELLGLKYTVIQGLPLASAE